VVRLDQHIGGIPVWQARTTVLVSEAGQPTAVTGLPEVRSILGSFELEPRAAADHAFAHQRPDGPPLRSSPQGRDGSERFELTDGGQSGVRLLAPLRVRRVYFASEAGLVPAYAVDVASEAGARDRRGEEILIDARDGAVLAVRSTLAHAHTYRVWTADPAGTPGESPLGSVMPYPGTEPIGAVPAPLDSTLVEVTGLNHNPDGEADPWLADGATTTQGNNVDAYVDFTEPNGLNPSSGEFRAEVTAAGVFDHAYDTNLGPLDTTTQSSAAVVQAFYAANWLHDWYYDSGFDEAAGNAQVENFGRGGLDGDALRLEVQDAALSGDPQRNNANMQTPPDGSGPIMQIYVWSPVSSSILVADPGGAYPSRPAAFGPATFEVSGPLVSVNDGTADVMDGCQTITADLSGKVALIRRGGCPFVQKAEAAEAAGAIGTLIVDNVEGVPPIMDGDSQTAGPTLSTTMQAGDALIEALTSGTVTVELSRTPAVERDGALDGTLVAHEWGHYLQDRLAPCAPTAIVNGVPEASQCYAMGEGGGDFVALHMLLADGDDPALVYPMAGYAAAALTPDLYFGLRRVPYSTSLDINPLTFRHIEDGETLPSDVPSYPSPAPNSEVHNAGEVWTTMLFEVYAALIAEAERPDDPRTFQDVRRDMSDDLVLALSMMPSARTMLDARDVLLSTIAARSETDALAAAAAFAKRGAGSCAVAPAFESTTNLGVEEDFELSPELTVALVSAVDAECDNQEDGILDAGETGFLEVEVENLGYGAADGATVSLSNLPPALSALEGAEITLDAVPGLGSATARFPIELGDVTGIVDGEVTVSLGGALGCSMPPATEHAVAVNYDVEPTGGVADDFSTDSGGWSVVGERAETIWKRTGSGIGAIWHGNNYDSISSTALVSPPLEVGTTEPLEITFSHRYSFEDTEGQFWDGGVIEVSVDDGATWMDVAELVGGSPEYSGALAAISNNPLMNGSQAARPAFVGESPGYPDFAEHVVSLGSELAGETVRIAFRIGSDEFQGAPGWEIDEVTFSGLAQGPFPGRLPDATAALPCPEPPASGGTTGSGGDGAPPASGGSGTGGAALGSSGGSGGSGSPTAPEAGGGCGCRLGGPGSSHGAAAGLLALALCVWARRRTPAAP